MHTYSAAIEALLSDPSNRHCADCLAAVPSFASPNLGIFLCTSCAALHARVLDTRLLALPKLGSSLSSGFPANLEDPFPSTSAPSADSWTGWTPAVVAVLQNLGNARVNARLLHQGSPLPLQPPPPGAGEAAMAEFLRNKYMRRRASVGPGIPTTTGSLPLPINATPSMHNPFPHPNATLPRRAGSFDNAAFLPSSAPAAVPAANHPSSRPTAAITLPRRRVSFAMPSPAPAPAPTPASPTTTPQSILKNRKDSAVDLQHAAAAASTGAAELDEDTVRARRALDEAVEQLKALGVFEGLLIEGATEDSRRRLAVEALKAANGSLNRAANWLLDRAASDRNQTAVSKASASRDAGASKPVETTHPTVPCGIAPQNTAAVPGQVPTAPQQRLSPFTTVNSPVPQHQLGTPSLANPFGLTASAIPAHLAGPRRANSLPLPSTIPTQPAPTPFAIPPAFPAAMPVILPASTTYLTPQPAGPPQPLPAPSAARAASVPVSVSAMAANPFTGGATFGKMVTEPDATPAVATAADPFSAAPTFSLLGGATGPVTATASTRLMSAPVATSGGLSMMLFPTPAAPTSSSSLPSALMQANPAPVSTLVPTKPNPAPPPASIFALSPDLIGPRAETVATARAEAQAAETAERAKREAEKERILSLFEAAGSSGGATAAGGGSAASVLGEAVAGAMVKYGEGLLGSTGSGATGSVASSSPSRKSSTASSGSSLTLVAAAPAPAPVVQSPTGVGGARFSALYPFSTIVPQAKPTLADLAAADSTPAPSNRPAASAAPTLAELLANTGSTARAAPAAGATFDTTPTRQAKPVSHTTVGHNVGSTASATAADPTLDRLGMGNGGKGVAVVPFQVATSFWALREAVKEVEGAGSKNPFL
ncbi:SPARC- modular calcium-binding protein 2 [Phlyctochytrium bullatum]|nr:SPARC- modular calcium-binding protein 2 [Phlyctochytrium bullatum]